MRTLLKYDTQKRHMFSIPLVRLKYYVNLGINDEKDTQQITIQKIWTEVINFKFLMR